MILLLASLLVAQTIELYEARFRPADELVPIATSALGAEGQVTLDARTATLILNGSPAAVRRALALLEQMDRALSTVIVDVSVREVTDVETLGARVAWKTTLGGVRVGTMPFGPDGLAVAVDGSRASETRTASSSLRLLEGATGVVRTGTALPVLFASYWATTTAFVPVETGFEVSARLLAGDEIFLELRPFAGRVTEGGALRYIAAATSVSLRPGETVVLAEVARDAQSSTTDLSGVERDVARHQQIVFLAIELER